MLDRLSAFFCICMLHEHNLLWSPPVGTPFIPSLHCFYTSMRKGANLLPQSIRFLIKIVLRRGSRSKAKSLKITTTRQIFDLCFVYTASCSSFSNMTSFFVPPSGRETWIISHKWAFTSQDTHLIPPTPGLSRAGLNRHTEIWYICLIMQCIKYVWSNYTAQPSGLGLKFNRRFPTVQQSLLLLCLNIHSLTCWAAICLCKHSFSLFCFSVCSAVTVFSLSPHSHHYFHDMSMSGGPIYRDTQVSLKGRLCIDKERSKVREERSRQPGDRRRKMGNKVLALQKLRLIGI